MYGGLTKAQYTTLSRFAPVVAQPEEHNDFGVPWQKQTEIIGKALGQEAKAASMVDGVEADLKAAAAENPAFGRSKGVVATPYEGTFVSGSQDPRSRVLTDLLDTDAIVWIAGDPAKDEAKLHKDALYGDLKVARQQREVYIEETSDYGKSVSFVTVLGLPYMLDRLVPQPAAAVDGDPATKVPAPSA